MKFAVALLLAVVTVMPSYALNKKQCVARACTPDFSGTWELNPKESDFVNASGNSKRRVGHEEKTASGKENIGYVTLYIEHRGAELRVFQKRRFAHNVTNELIFYSDARGENNTDTVNGSIDSRTEWDGTSLVTTFFRKSDAGEEPSMNVARTTWELSEDGNTLTIIKIRQGYSDDEYPGFSVNRVAVNVKLVYQRTQG